MEERKERHPGQLERNMGNVRAVVTHEVKEIKAAVKPLVREGEKAAVSVAKEGAKLAAQDRVKIGFYMESMCPGCKYFTVKVNPFLVVFSYSAVCLRCSCVVAKVFL